MLIMKLPKSGAVSMISSLPETLIYWCGSGVISREIISGLTARNGRYPLDDMFNILLSCAINVTPAQHKRPPV